MRHRLGRRAEAWAVGLLRLKGYRILARRWRSRDGEIDIVAARGQQLVFVEVKGRHREEMFAISRRQRRRLERAAQMFLARNPQLAHCEMRFDAILCLPRQLWRPLSHIRDAWREGGV